MRSCDEIVELISASLDGELSADEQTALKEHIACCPACSALLDDLRALHEAAAEPEEVPAPAGFAEGVMSAIAADPAQETADKVIPFTPKKAKTTPWKKWGMTAAAVAIVVLGAVSVPSLTGNFARKSADSADMNYAVFDKAAEVAMETENYSINMTQTDSVCYDEEEQTALEDAVPAESALSGEKYSASTAPYIPTKDGDPSSADLQSGEERYVGVLTLEGMLESLSGQEGAASSDGTATYIVTADIFAEVLKELEAEKPVGYSYTALSDDAQWGKIIVQNID